MCAVATLDTLSLLMAERVWVRRYAVSAWHLTLKNKHYLCNLLYTQFPAT